MLRTPQLFAALILTIPLTARAEEVRGKVVDPNTGEGLPAAYIQIKGKETQTVATEQPAPAGA